MITYSILYPPRVPRVLPAFELGEPTDTWRFYFEPSIGNKISDFRGGFIRIRSQETERNALYPGKGGYLDEYLPFRNPFAENIDPLRPDRNILQPKGYNTTIPAVDQDERGEYFIDIPHETFTLSKSPRDTRYKTQTMFTANDWVSSTEDRGRGNIQIYNDELKEYINIDSQNYFSGNLVQKGLSEWSTICLVSPVSTADYRLVIDNNVIKSSIYEFVGTYVEDSANSNTFFNPNFLRAYKIDIYRAFGSEKESLTDSSGWIVGQETKNLQIKWQNKIELENKQRYIVELTIQTVWDLRKTITYHVNTEFESSSFRGSVEVSNDHNHARANIKIQMETPLTWGPKENVSLSEMEYDFVDVGEMPISVEQGLDFFGVKGALGGEMIVTGVDVVEGYETEYDRYIFKMSGPELSRTNQSQEEYYIYAHSKMVGEKPESPDIPYEEDIIINPVLESPTGETFQLYMDHKGYITTMPSDEPSSHTFLLVRDPDGRYWRVTVLPTGQLETHITDDVSEPRFVREPHLHDVVTNSLGRISVDYQGRLMLTNVASNYIRGKYVKPQWINEFRLVKLVYVLELGRKTNILKQTYRAFLTDYDGKLGDWEPITPDKHYYLYFATMDGQIRLIVRDLDAVGSALDRYTAARLGESAILPESTMFIGAEGVDSNYQVIRDTKGDRTHYTVSIDDRGALVANESFIGTASTATPKREREGEN